LAQAVAGTTSDWTAAYACAEAASGEGAFAAAEFAAGNAAWAVADHTIPDDEDDSGPTHARIRSAEQVVQATLLRDIFGNPFRPAALDPAWRTETVLALARGIYEERAFDRMPILADALQDAGCTDEDVLSHCRGPGPHARGCWVVDLVLGKE
jgi:hypothetical protein